MKTSYMMFSQNFRTRADFLAVGGTATHVQMAFQIETLVEISALFGKVKGASSHQMNAVFGRNTLQWQHGYGVVSFSKRQLAHVQNYIENQKEHHAKETLVAGLEISADENDSETRSGD